MAISFTRPQDLPAAASVSGASAIPVDSGPDVEKATPKQIVDAGRPIASESQAVAGTDNATAMTPLTTRQAINADISGSVNTAKEAALAAEEAAEESQQAAASIQPYASRAAAEAANIPAPVNRIDIFSDDGGVKSYRKNPRGVSLVTADGARWSIIHDWAKEKVALSAYIPSVTRVGVDTGSELYRHVPSIAVKSEASILGAYLYNDSSAAESAPGQRACFVRSTNNGATWSAKVEELNEAATANNPLTPQDEGGLQGEVFVLYDRAEDQEIATVAHRGSSAGSNRAFVSFRNASGGKWTNYGIVFDSTTNAVVVSNTDVNGAAGAGHKLTYRIDGIEYDVIPFKPVFADSGELVIPLLVVTIFGGKHRVTSLIRDVSGNWTMGGVIPVGECPDGSAWEPTTWQAADGTWYCQARNNTGVGAPTSDNHIIATSSDLKSWTPFVFLDERMHVNRHMRMRARDDLWLGVGSSHYTNRNSLDLWISSDGHNFVYGPTIGNEDDGVDFTQYSDLDVYEGSGYAFYTEQADKDTSAAPNEVYFARFTLPDSNPVSGSRRNQYEFNSGTAPSVSGDVLTLPPLMSGAIATPGVPFVLSIRVRVTVPPGAEPYTLLSVGDDRGGFFSLEYRNNGGDCELYAGGVFVGTVDGPTEFASFDVAVDPLNGNVSAFGQSKALRRFCRVYLGDLEPSAAQSGNIEYDAAGSDLTIYRNGLPKQTQAENQSRIFGSVTAKSDNGSSDLVSDAGPGSVSNIRHRIDGVTKAVSLFNDAASKWFLQVLGSNVLDASASLIQSLVAHTFTARATFLAPINLGIGSALTVSGGVITPTRSYHKIDTEGAAATDDLDTITPGSTGDILVLGSATSTRDVTVKHATGNIFCGSDRTLNNVSDRITLICDGSNWHMISYADN